MRKFGYCRVSTPNQAKKNEFGEYVGSLKVQRDTLISNGVDESRIIIDIASGKNFDRKGIDELLIKMEKGDKLLVPKLDRLGRNTLEMLEIVELFNEKGITVKFISENLDTGDSLSGKLILTILSAVATAERERIMERTNEGRLDAKSRGVKFGRKPVIDNPKIHEMKAKGLNNSQIARELKISRSSVIRALRDSENDN